MKNSKDYKTDYPDECMDEMDPDIERPCLVCGGSGFMDNPDPLWYGLDKPEIPCTSCGGSGRASDMTYC